MEETWLINFEPIDSPMNPIQRLMVDQGKIFSHPDRYRRLLPKFIYLTTIRLDIGVVSQFMYNPHIDHCSVVARTFRYV